MGDVGIRLGSTLKPRVLVVDDEVANVDLLHRVLRRQYEVLRATSGRDALAQLAQYPDIAVIITDQRMPELSGVDLLAESVRLVPDAGRMILTGYAEYGHVLEAINRGHVNHFMLKPVEPALLVKAVAATMEIHFLAREKQFVRTELESRNLRLCEHEQELERLVAERTAELSALNLEYRRANERLEEANRMLVELALRDGLTGLYNHGYLQERLVAEVARARRHGHPLSLLFIDIDHFKHVNDSHGHPTGDGVLRSMANLLVSGVRANDVVARYGGEEFALILPETPKDGAKVKAELIRDAVAKHVFQVGGVDVKLTLSIGVSAYPADATDAPSLIRQADTALYRAKACGRNRVCYLEEDPSK